ncbi:hypothetical protein G039_0332140 [Pseudomonas aeruginosa VRFPA01]|nr:hypothetical protein G039_0332140 [Pseudomonas aeruginosa VRFPA01]
MLWCLHKGRDGTGEVSVELEYAGDRVFLRMQPQPQTGGQFSQVCQVAQLSFDGFSLLEHFQLTLERLSTGAASDELMLVLQASFLLDRPSCTLECQRSVECFGLGLQTGPKRSCRRGEWIE